MSNEQIIFFDGVCNLCNGFINFLIKVDHQRVYKIASLQGQTAKDHLPQLFQQNLSTVVFLKMGKISTKADAVIQIISGLGPIWRVFNLLRLVPFKNFFYDQLSTNRYSLFGQRAVCRVPTTEEQERFLP